MFCTMCYLYVIIAFIEGPIGVVVNDLNILTANLEIADLFNVQEKWLSLKRVGLFIFSLVMKVYKYGICAGT